jgi:flavin reductase (DIM6/NTAB) family NADH-FMN oxidoreductase RutF
MIDETTFRGTLGRFASGVTIVTAAGPHGNCGMTVSAFCSLSLSPPLVLMCIEHTASMYETLSTASHFAVNVLRATHEPLARAFSEPGKERFEDIEFRQGANGVPVLTNPLALLECRKQDSFPGGDHTIFTGVVEQASFSTGEPLVYFCGQYLFLPSE